MMRQPIVAAIPMLALAPVVRDVGPLVWEVEGPTDAVCIGVEVSEELGMVADEAGV